jgi:cell division protein FtsL
MRTYQLLRRVWGPAPTARDSVVMMVVLAALVTLLAIAQVRRRHEVVRAGYELSRQTQRLEDLRARNRALSVELATLTHPDRLRQLAEKLGMVPAQPDQIRVVQATGQLAQTEPTP